MERKLRCHGCGKTFMASSSHAVAHCSPACRDARKSREAAHGAALEAAGFVRDEEAPNIYRNGDYAITLEEADRGVEHAIERHSRWRSQHAPA